MKTNYLILSFVLCMFLLPVTTQAQKQFQLKSPDGKIEVTINVGKTIDYSVSHSGDLLLDKSAISIALEDGSYYGVNASLSGSTTKTVNQTIMASIYKRKQILNNFNELTLKFKGNYNIVFKAYNEGIAYRFVSLAKKPFIVKNEQAEFNFTSDSKIFVTYANQPETLSIEEQFFNSFEQPYNHINISGWNKKRIGLSPVLVECVNGKKICITDADLMNYPGMFIYPGDKKNSLKSVYAPYPKDVVQGGHNELQMLVKSRENYIAKFNGATNFPWRVIVVSEKDADLADIDLVYKLASPPVGDYSWVKPGKVAWDWWNDWNLYGVDFKAGVNNETYKHYIDFASEYGIEYVILDEGWAVNKKADLLQVIDRKSVV